MFIAHFCLVGILTYLHKCRSLKQRNVIHQTACYFFVEVVAMICNRCLHFEASFLKVRSDSLISSAITAFTPSTYPIISVTAAIRIL